MAIALPTSADVRRIRKQADEVVNAQWDMVRAPVLAWIGASDHAVHTLRELPDRLRGESLRERADETNDRARRSYNRLTERGERTVEDIRTQPRVARALRSVRDTNDRFNSWVEKMVDELHDAGNEMLDAVSFESRSIGEKAARRTQRVSREAASMVTDFSGEVAKQLEELGDDAARETRSASRRAANRTAPAEENGVRPTANATS
ncbi:MAG TPA: hypothetical protein VGH99_22705 [Pseudonocardia sp.]